MLKKLDTKSIIIIILASLLLLFGWLHPNQRINYYKDELKNLRLSNEKLIHSNDSLKNEKNKIDVEIKKLKDLISANQVLIKQYDNTIQDLKNRKDEIPNKVNVLSADMVASQFTNYLKRRPSKNNLK